MVHDGPSAALEQEKGKTNRQAKRRLSGAFFGYFLSPHERK
jgi:hypothetical protein